MTRLEALYKSKIKNEMQKEFNYKNCMELPKIQKIVISMGVGEGSKDKKLVEGAVRDMTTIAGQKPVICKARKSVSNFKLREGMDIGCKVTLRRSQMFEFLDRLIALAIPRVRDFRGLTPKGFDSRGNFSMGLNEQMVFPEIDPDKITKVQGMNINIVTSAKTDDEARFMLKQFGMPFRATDKIED
ncbi:MAG: 50S ribosomal protein L5 [Phycisphaerae bacterium]|nr:50S ribosomal protein L5 [Phycisphaerae bacterium]